MLCNIPEDSMQCSYAKGFVPGNGEIVRVMVNYR